MQGSSFSHSDCASHPPVCVSQRCKDYGDRDAVISGRLLKLHTIMVLYHPTSTTARPECPSAQCHDDAKTHHICQLNSTGFQSPLVLTFNYVQDTYLWSIELHPRLIPAAQIVSGSAIRGDPPAISCSTFLEWEPVSSSEASHTARHIWNTLPDDITDNLNARANWRLLYRLPIDYHVIPAPVISLLHDRYTAR